MANEKNLEKGVATQFSSGEVAARNGKKGGKKKAQNQKERKTIQTILADYLDKDVKSNPKLKEIAEIAGIKGKQSVKELVTAVCILNTLKKGDVDKLQKLCELLGEDNGKEHLEDVSEAEADIFGD